MNQGKINKEVIDMENFNDEILEILKKYKFLTDRKYKRIWINLEPDAHSPEVEVSYIL